MYIYNVTVKLDWSIHEAWLLWMQEEHIPEMLETKHFYKYQMVRLVEVEQEEGPTYAIQYYAQTREDYHRFIHSSAALLAAKSARAWGEKCIHFATLMEVVH